MGSHQYLCFRRRHPLIASVTTTRNGQKYRVHKRQVRKQLTVAELTVGMYVVELDIPWEESPFLFQGFLLESEKDIHMVQDHCKSVWVDVVEEDWVPLDKTKNTQRVTRTCYVEKQDMARQLSEANRTYQAAKVQVKQLFASAHLGQALNMKQAQVTVKDCVQRVISNPNAMLWLTRLKHQDEYEKPKGVAMIEKRRMGGETSYYLNTR